MSGATNSCPGSEDLRAFCLGRPTASAPAEEIAAHLADCPDCGTLLESLNTEADALVAGLRRLPERATFLDEPECRQLEARVAALRIDSSANGASLTASAPVPAPRQLGQYRLLEQIGQGGMGVVYRAIHTRLRKTVALKVLPAHRVDDPRAVARFQREMEAMGALNHPHLIQALDAGEEAGCHFLAMELVDGLDLAQLVRLVGPLPVADACEVIRQAADGLQAAHALGLVHRDIKPSNLMLTTAGQVKILDLGLARLIGEHFSPDELTSSNQVMGTADYMAPEQADAAHAVDIRADVYSLGCTLFKLLVGRPPFAGPAYSSVLKKVLAHARTAVPPVRQLRPDVPAALEAVLARFLAKNREARYATPAAAAEALAPFAQGSDLPRLIAAARGSRQAEAAAPHTTTHSASLDTGAAKSATASTPPAWLRTRIPQRRRWILVAGAALVALAAVGFGAAFLAPPREDAPPAHEEKAKPTGWKNGIVELPCPRKTDESFWSLDERQGELNLYSPGPVLLALGKAGEDGVRLEITFRQAGWAGGVGLFFGYHDGEFNRLACKRFQSITLGRYDEGPGRRVVYRLRREVTSVLRNSGVIRPFTLTTAEVRRPTPADQRLGLTLTRGKLTSVRWNGAEVTGLADPLGPQTAAEVGPDDYRGDFGVVGAGGASAFHNPSY